MLFYCGKTVTDDSEHLGPTPYQGAAICRLGQGLRVVDDVRTSAQIVRLVTSVYTFLYRRYRYAFSRVL